MDIVNEIWSANEDIEYDSVLDTRYEAARSNRRTERQMTDWQTRATHDFLRDASSGQE